MDRERFEWLVAKAVDSLPDEFHSKMENIDVVVEEQPTRSQLVDVGLKRGETLLGSTGSLSGCAPHQARQALRAGSAR